MAVYPFVIGDTYSRNDIYRICNIPEEKQGGDWNTGYHRHETVFFIFCSIGVAGRTGHTYRNRFEGGDLIWYGTTGSHVEQKTITSMLEPGTKIYIFYRFNKKPIFSYAGLATAKSYKSYKGEKPIQITWTFSDSDIVRLAEEIEEPKLFMEGTTKTISVVAYERNAKARQACLDEYGYSCTVCDMSFLEEYGEIGRDFIHVHHLKALSEIGTKYKLDPLEDLRPVCPNCHAMLHRRKPAYSIEELVEIRAAARVAGKG